MGVVSTSKLKDYEVKILTMLMLLLVYSSNVLSYGLNLVILHFGQVCPSLSVCLKKLNFSQSDRYVRKVQSYLSTNIFS